MFVVSVHPVSVVKILMALHYDNYYVDDLNEAAKDRLLAKLSKRKGPIVQMGFGLHAGNAVQGAIGSQRKLDATYSECFEIYADLPMIRTLCIFLTQVFVFVICHSFRICGTIRISRIIYEKVRCSFAHV